MIITIKIPIIIKNNYTHNMITKYKKNLISISWCSKRRSRIMKYINNMQNFQKDKEYEIRLPIINGNNGLSIKAKIKFFSFGKDSIEILTDTKIVDIDEFSYYNRQTNSLNFNSFQRNNFFSKYD